MRRLPEPPDGKRVETGPTKFGDDWCGLFLRGDNLSELYLLAKEKGWAHMVEMIEATHEHSR